MPNVCGDLTAATDIELKQYTVTAPLYVDVVTNIHEV